MYEVEIMENSIIDPRKFYASYPEKVMLRPGYPARALCKSMLAYKLYGKRIMKELGEIKTYTDIGGCFGFGANAMAYNISRHQGHYPDTKVFEISPDFITMGKILFPYIDFIEGEFDKWSGTPPVFDLVTLFDVVEHLPSPEHFLREVSKRARYILLNTPMETTGEWRGSRPLTKPGEFHPDGHINFYSPKVYRDLLRDSGLEIIKEHLFLHFIPPGSYETINPEWPLTRLKSLAHFIFTYPLLPYGVPRKILAGGRHLCLAKPAGTINSYNL